MSRSRAGSTSKAAPKMPEGVPEEAIELEATDEKMMEDLQQALKEYMPIDRTILIQFVRGYKSEKERWEATLSKLTEALKWRKDSGVDQILEKPLDREEQFFKMYPHDFHGYSKTGYPVYIEDSCFSDPSKLLEEFPVEEQQRFHIQMMEMLAALKRKKTKETGFRTYKHIVIMDLYNLGRKHMGSKFTGPIKSQINLDQYYYPECLSRLYIINAPWTFRMLWAMVKPWLHPLTQKRISILGGDFTEKLKEVIDADQLPRYLGGECSCCPADKKLSEDTTRAYKHFLEIRKECRGADAISSLSEDVEKKLQVEDANASAPADTPN